MRMPTAPDPMQTIADVLTKLANASPHHAIYDILKDFQPLIAALVALFAASLAYKGANAKVNFDRELAKRQHTKERLGVYIRLISQLKKIAFDAGIVTLLTSAILEVNGGQDITDWGKTKFDFETRDYVEVENAWRQIELLPLEAVEVLNRVRIGIENVRFGLTEVSGLTELKADQAKSIGDTASSMMEIADELRAIVEKAMANLAVLD
jgi:hypothetical protein